MDLNSPPELLYKYAKLTKTTHFRQLHLNPSAQSSAPLSGSLHECDLDGPSEYECLSYVWGTGQKTARLFVDGKIVPITESLHTALLHLRRSEDIKVIWIDQISINQEDLEERSQQVQHMDRIYAQARRDYLWMGESTESTACALQWFKNILSNGSTGLHLSDAVASKVDSAELKLADESEAEKWLRAHEPSPKEQVGLRQLFYQNTVWERMWIVQEIMLSREVLIVSGQWTFDIDLVAFILARAFGGGPGKWSSVSHKFHDMFARVVQHITYRQRYKSTGSIPLDELLHVFGPFKATNPRDKVYALLGLTRDIEIIPDYTKPIGEVFAETATAMVNRSGSLDLICFDKWDTCSEDTFEVPSWVPCFLHGWRCTLPLIANVHSEPLYRASKPRREGEIASFFTANNRITARGCPVRVIEHLSPPRVFDASKDGEWQVEVFYMIPFKPTPSEPTPLAALRAMSDEQCDALWRTLIRDRNASGARLTEREVPTYRYFFRQWYQNMCEGYLSGFEAGEPQPGFMTALASSDDCCLALTGQKGLAMVPRESKVGDEICILKAANVPLVVRRVDGKRDEKKGIYTKLGTAFVYGLMDGKVWNHPEEYPERTYKFV